MRCAKRRQRSEGEFLEGLDLPDCETFQSWCIAEREETRRLRARVLTVLIARLDGTPDEALPYARALSLTEPADEGAHATLVRLLRAAGRWREAEQQFRAAQHRLEEFNVARTGALRQAAQEMIQPAAPARVDRATPGARHDVQYCRAADGVRIAYASVGDGPPLVWAAHWLSHLTHSWESPIWRHWTEEFAQDHSFIHYDERGNGLSDWEADEFSVDAFVADLEAVVNALGLERFALIGSSKGGPTAMAYVARHPERVSHLILYGAFAQGWKVRGDAADIERREAIATLTRQGWAQDNPAFRQILTSLLLPDATLEEMAAFNDLQRISASAENAARLQRSTGAANVLDLLPRIAAPTLVLHCRGDVAMPFEREPSSPAAFRARGSYPSKAATTFFCHAIRPGPYSSTRSAAFCAEARQRCPAPRLPPPLVLDRVDDPKIRREIGGGQIRIRHEEVATLP